MVKKRGLIIGVMFLFILACMNLFLFFNKSELSYSGLSGRFIQDLPENLFHLNMSLIFFLLEWVILILIAIIIYSSFLKHKKNYLTQQDYHIIKQKKSKSETDLDVLYDLLKSKKKLNLSTITKVFKIPKNKALEWARILENHELATINYPTFRDPEVKINEKETKEKEKNKKAEKGKKRIEKAAKTREKQKTRKSQKTK